MKKSGFLLVMVFLAQLSFSQVAVVNFMKVPAGGQDKYVTLEGQWKSAIQKLVNEGKLIGWQLYYVHNSGTMSDYNFVTVNMYKDLSSSVNGVTMDNIRKVWGDKTNEMLKKTGEARDLIYSVTSGYQFGIPPKTNAKYILVNFMKTADPQSYFNMERTAYMPMHKVAIDEGKLTSWSVWMPYLYDDNSYNALTVNGYESADQIGDMDYSGWFKKATEGMSESDLSMMNDLVQNTDKMRTIVKTQLWELVDMTDPAPEGQTSR